MDAQPPQAIAAWPPEGERLAFLRYEVMSASVIAAFGRNKIYAPGTEPAHKDTLRRDLRKRLHELSTVYRSPISDGTHFDNIEDLSTDLSGRACLIGKTFRLGSAQKALNLYLKYLWCLGEIPEPPHCPCDGRVIGALGVTGIVWTKLNHKAEYQTLVEAARTRATRKGLSIATWELRSFNMGRT